MKFILMILKRLLFLTISLFFCITTYSQTTGVGLISGIVKDSITSHPIEFVNVLLQSNVDRARVAGTITDNKGKFEFNKIIFGNYLIKLSYLGYKDKTITPLKINSKSRVIDLGTILLSDTTVTLEEVLVSSQKSLFSNTIEKKVYNVSQDIMSKSGSASDLLQNVPSVQVDIDGNVSLRGSSNVLIMINGKTSPLMGRYQSTVLQSLPANTIDKIEVITNPSAKYRPDGTTGIINIVLKKNKDSGFNGTIDGNLGFAGRHNAGFHLNYNTGDLNIFGGYNLRKDNRKRVDTDSRQQIDGVNVTNYNQNNDGLYYPLSHFVTLGADYSLDNSDQFGLSGNYFYNSFTRNDFSNNLYTDGSGGIIENYNRNRHDNEFEKETDYTIYFEHLFSGDEHKLRFEFTGSHAPEQEDNHFTNIYYNPFFPTTYDNTLIKQSEDINQLTVQYTDPISENTNFEAGYDGNIHKNDFNFYSEYFDAPQNKFVINTRQTSHFIYNENIHAVYGILEHNFGSFGLQGGLRVEQSFGKANLVSTDSSFNKDFFNLYPTMHFSYNLSDLSKILLSYSRRVRRPETDDINPFPEYRDPRNVRAGNPNLLPEYIHSIELGFSYQNDQYSILPSIYYRYRTNSFSKLVSLINDTTSLTTEVNLSHDQSAGFELTLSGNAGNFIVLNLTSDVFYDKIDATNLGYGNNKSVVSFSGNGTLDLNLTGSFLLQLNSNYRSARLTPQGEFRPRFVVNLGAKQEFMNGKLSLLLTISDLFATLKREIVINTPQLKETVTGTRDSRIFYLGVAYNFGSQNKKTKGDQLKYDEN
jgi:outer membrane receptor protein involved in Fe transport